MPPRPFVAVVAAALFIVPRSAVAQRAAPVPVTTVAAVDSSGGAVGSALVKPRAITALAREGKASGGAAARFSAARVNAAPRLPVGGGSGAAVLHVQTLLAAANFSPGVVDGAWRERTRRAVRAFRAAHGLAPGDVVDAATLQRLREVASERTALLEYVVTPADVRGPFRRIPQSPYARAGLDCLCYSSAAEKLSERFQTTPATLRQLNPGVAFDRLAAGTVIQVPNVARVSVRALPVRLIVEKGAGTLRGLDALGATVFVLPASVGSARNPSPSGRLRVLSVSHDPWYQYNPSVLTGGRGSGATADLPPGPNSPVGVVWIQLSKAHVGIHGTPDPEDIGVAESHGCVRLTNWDAEFLAELVQPGLEVELRD